MRATERDVLLFLLAAGSGAADGWSYMGLGHAFVANMTGNTVLAGLAVFNAHRDIVHPGIALGSYLAGAALAALMTRKSAGIWPRAISWTLLLEAGVLAGCEAAWATARDGASAVQVALPTTGADVLLGLVAFAVGLQSGAMLQLKIPGVVTTYITGTWTRLVSGLVKFASGERRDSPPEKAQFEARLAMQGGVLAVYFLSAALTGWLFRYEPSGVGGLPAVVVAVVASYGLIRGQEQVL